MPTDRPVPSTGSTAAAPGPDGDFRRRAWERYRSAAQTYARNSDDRAAADALEQAVAGLRRAAAVEAWRQPASGA